MAGSLEEAAVQTVVVPGGRVACAWPAVLVVPAASMAVFLDWPLELIESVGMIKQS